MDILSVDTLEKILNPKDIVTFWVIWMFVKRNVAAHFSSIEQSLKTIGQNIQSLKESILLLEQKQTKEISDLSVRVDKLEGR